MKKPEPTVVEDDESQTPKEPSSPEEHNEAIVNGRPMEDSRPEAPTTPLPGQLRPVSRPRTPGVKQMRWGDKFDLVEAVALREPENEEDIDWYDLAATMKHTWPIRTLQAALKELLDLVMDQGTLSETAIELLQYLGRQFTDDELKEHYNQYQDMELDENADAVEDHELTEAAELEEGKDSVTAANLPNTKRKRKLGADKSQPRSCNASTEKKNTKSRPDTPPSRVKSKYFVTESDDAESGQEL